MSSQWHFWLPGRLGQASHSSLVSEASEQEWALDCQISTRTPFWCDSFTRCLAVGLVIDVSSTSKNATSRTMKKHVLNASSRSQLVRPCAQKYARDDVPK